MALNAYLSITGKKQGLIKGSVIQKGREGKIMVIAAEHEVRSPRDAVSGLPAAKRVHGPFVVTKEVDASSPCLYTALVANELLPTWELQFWGQAVNATIGGAGAEVLRYVVRLSNASISDIRFHMPNSKDPELQRYAEYEEVSFTYEKIEWTWTMGGIKASDDLTALKKAAPKRKPAAKRSGPAKETRS